MRKKKTKTRKEKKSKGREKASRLSQDTTASTSEPSVSADRNQEATEAAGSESSASSVEEESHSLQDTPPAPPSAQIHVQEPANQEPVSHALPPNPRKPADEGSAAATPTSAASLPPGGVSMETTEGRSSQGGGGSAHGRGAGNENNKSRKDAANSQRANGMGPPAKQTTKPAEQPGLKPAQPPPSADTPQAGESNVSVENAGTDQEVAKRVPGSEGDRAGTREEKTTPPSTPVDTHSPGTHKEDLTADHNDDEGFQTVSSKKKRKKQSHIPQNEMNLQQAAFGDQVTIYFHAVLSKDFKLDPGKDQVWLEGGNPWTCLAKMEVTR
ncbi:hypothetical protein MATL_G00000190 [Megalops atlanticus]|uniref:Uncharacterized protein n=1 Tax=Megalops atlanticus TaxID=7932 RepID=A0A9D3TKK2_MEGAT|nr:hypothetical protein MATL_G00000190 [Megalops atlanticus]